jgi:hypothetical protein
MHLMRARAGKERRDQIRVIALPEAELRRAAGSVSSPRGVTACTQV